MRLISQFGKGLLPISMLAGLAVAAGSAASSTSKTQKWDGSRISPVHQIPLKDESNQAIIPSESNPLPFSTRFTCAPCHDYGTIRQGLHFNRDAVSKAGRPGEPWIWLDERTGTQLPLSYRPGKGLWEPGQLGLSAWDFTLLFGRNLPGGGVSEPEDKDMTPESRWNVSGKIEINCLACHHTARVQNLSEWAKQVLRQNFRWAATAASGLGEVGGIASRLRPTWDIFDGPNRDDTEWAVAPYVKYDKTKFDSKHRALFDLAYKPEDRRCLACHSTSPSGIRKFDFDEDVHSAAGIPCAGCHRHDITHNMVRGYEGEAKDNPLLPSEDFTCKACHLGSETKTGKKILPGRMGAPYPLHKGIPSVHFDRLACTVCHSGPLPGKETARVRTSRANRLGIFGVATWATDLPAVLEPVHIRGADNKLTPNRLMWPAFWAEVRGTQVMPLKPDQVLAAAGDILFPEKAVTRVLAALFNVAELDGTPVLAMAGKTYQMNVDGGLDATPQDGGASGEELLWAALKEGRLSPIIPDFDPTNAETSIEPESRVQKVLEALASTEAPPGKPVLLFKGFLYQIIDAALDKSERKDVPAPQPRFAWLKDDALLPFVPEFEKKVVAELSGLDQTLTENQVARVLKTLGEKHHVYLAGGKLFRLNEKGNLLAESHAAAEPIAWPMAHQVRPARQSLGVNGCTDCHTFGSNFFFGKVESAGPLKTESVVRRAASSFMGLTQPYERLFGLSFTARPLFKIFLGICAAVIGALLLIVFLVTLGRVAGLIEKRR